MVLQTHAAGVAFERSGQPLILIVAGSSKAIFIALVLSQGRRYLGQQAGIALFIDFVMIVLFAWYLVAARAARSRPADTVMSRTL